MPRVNLFSASTVVLKFLFSVLDFLCCIAFLTQFSINKKKPVNKTNETVKITYYLGIVSKYSCNWHNSNYQDI